MTRISNTHTVSITNSELAALAGTMTSGQWSTFTMGGLNLALVYVEGAHSVIDYSARGHWDSAHKKIQFWGQGHYDDTKLITWDDATNLWSSTLGVPYSNPSPGTNIGHAYYHLAMDYATGDLYLRGYFSATIHKKPYGAAWTTVTGTGTWDYMQVAGGLEWFPALNGGAGGLAMFNYRECKVSNAAVSSWAYASGGSGAALSAAGDKHNWIARTTDFCYFGGGDSSGIGGSTAMYKLSPAGVVTSSVATPQNAGIWAESGATPVITHPNGTDLLCFGANPTTGAIYRFNGSSWSNIGTMNIGSGYTHWFAVPVPDYQCVVFIAQTSSVGTPIARVYKP